MNRFFAYTSALIVISCCGLAGCGSKPPACADSSTLKIIREIVVDETLKRVDRFLKDDPDKLLKGFTEHMKVDVFNILNEGYSDEIKRQQCRANLKITTVDNHSQEQRIQYSTRLIEDKKGHFSSK